MIQFINMHRPDLDKSFISRNIYRGPVGQRRIKKRSDLLFSLEFQPHHVRCAEAGHELY